MMQIETVLLLNCYGKLFEQVRLLLVNFELFFVVEQVPLTGRIWWPHPGPWQMNLAPLLPLFQAFRVELAVCAGREERHQ